MSAAPQLIREIPVHLIYPNPDQPRKTFLAEPLQELANSIKELGLMQPITIVPRKTTNGSFMVVAGERRWRATQLAGLANIQAIVREDLSDADVAELALVENLLRADLNIVEEARAYQSFLDRGYTVESLGKLLGFSQSWRITERTNLLKLEASLLEGVVKGAVEPAQATELARLSPDGQFRLWRAIQDGKCSTYTKLRSLSNAIFEQEHQSQMFKTDLDEKDKAAIDKVEQFLAKAGTLLSSITKEDLSIIEQVAKSNAQSCADKAALLEVLCRQVKNALLSNAGKQEALRA